MPLRVPLVLARSDSAPGVIIQELRHRSFSFLLWTSFPYGKVKAETSADSEAVEKQSVTTDKQPIPDEGVLASVACNLIMKVRWAAGLARPDLLRAVNRLATKVTKRTPSCDTMMCPLMGYIQKYPAPGNDRVGR